MPPASILDSERNTPDRGNCVTWCPTLFYTFGSVFGSELKIHTFVLDITIFPRSYGLSLLRIGACQLWAWTFDAPKIDLKFFRSYRIGVMGPMGPKCETFVTFGISAMIEISLNIEAAPLNLIKN